MALKGTFGTQKLADEKHLEPRSKHPKSGTLKESALNRELDHEAESEHEVVVTLTDGQLGRNNYITQSLLIIVLDENDNPPVFSQPQTSVTVPENVNDKVD